MTAPGDLQFDRAEPAPSAAPASGCAVCKRPLTDEYYEVNGKVVCPTCRTGLATHVASGSFVNALVLGLGAAILGAGIYFAIELLTGYEFGLVAIVVGLLVGTAVRKASRGAGGWRYQVLAIALTYLSVVATDASLIVRAAIQEARSSADSLVVAGSDSAAPQAGPVTIPGGQADSVAAASIVPRRPALAIVMLLGFMLAAPIMIGFSSPLHLLIVGFALYEAWKLNRTPAFTINGPFRLAAPAP